ncbi:helix loop helix DNA-binding domain protein [Ceratobasidium sp. AG-Ba]|nr:helix loop helix DNA-binding domain protein [Ceratobasidium sp. AG-Ba]
MDNSSRRHDHVVDARSTIVRQAAEQKLQAKLTASKMEVDRLRQINEALILKAAERPHSHFPL